MAYVMTLTMQSRLPIIFPGFVFPVVDCNMMSKAPEAPIITPAAFLKVIGSLSTRAAKIITATGVIAAIMEMLTGEVYRSALAKESCAPTNPNSAPKKRMNRSFRPTFSFLKNRLTIQKMRAAEIIRNKVSA